MSASEQTAPEEFVTLATEGGMYYVTFTWKNDRSRLAMTFFDRETQQREDNGVGFKADEIDGLRTFLERTAK